ncbi:MAG: phosphotransferase family protein [Sphingomonadaceae bacterium]
MAFRSDPAPEDWTAVARWLEAQGHRLDLGEAPRQFAGGLANRNYRVMLDGAPAVFRRPPPGPLAHGASDMAREAKVLRALAPHFPLAPQCLAFCPDPAVIGVPFQLLEWRPGTAVGGRLPEGFAQDSHGWMLPALVEVLAGLHRLAPGSVGLADLGKPSGFAARQLRGWARRAEAAFADEAPATLPILLRMLEDAIPPDAPASLLHMDPKFDNLLLDPAARRAIALIDWDMATQGPPAFDLAVLLSYWVEPDDPPEVHALEAVPSLAPGWPDRRTVVAAYVAAAGNRPADLAWYLALARLRLAVAWMQLYRLWQRGALAGARYAGFAALAAAILALAVARFGEDP